MIIPVIVYKNSALATKNINVAEGYSIERIFSST